MSFKDRQLADAHDAVEKAVAECNAVAKKILAEVSTYTGRDVQWMVAADSQDVMLLAFDLNRARSALCDAVNTFNELKRRG